jgi:prefoldin subunit 5
VDEVKRIKEENQEEVDILQQEIQQLKDQMNILQKSKQKIEQDLTDVHNYQESERGKRFQEMEVKPLSISR